MAHPLSFRDFCEKLAEIYSGDIGSDRLEIQKIRRAKYTDDMRALGLDYTSLWVIAFELYDADFDPLLIPHNARTFGVLYEFLVQSSKNPGA